MTSFVDFSELIEKHYLSIIRAALGYTGDMQQAQDMAHTAMLKACNARDSYKPELPFFPWMYCPAPVVWTTSHVSPGAAFHPGATSHSVSTVAPPGPAGPGGTRASGAGGRYPSDMCGLISLYS